MGLFKSPKAPAAPDPVQTSAAQGAANKEAILTSAKVNRIRDVNPYGTVDWKDLGDDRWERTTLLTDSGQTQLDQQNQLAEKFGSMAMGRADGLDDLPALNTDFSADANKVEKTTFDRAMGLMRPEFDDQKRSLETALSTKGIPIGSEAYEREMTRYGRNRSEAELAASLDSVRAGRSEQSRLFDQTQRTRSNAINELSALLQGAPAMPNAGAPAQYQMAPADVAGATNNNYLAKQNAYNQQLQSQQAGMGGLFQLGSTMMMACSREFKTNKREVEQILPRLEQLPVEAWEYKPEFGDSMTHIGPYAEDFQRLFGVGDGATISAIDAIGVCMLGIKELIQRTNELEAQING